MGHDRGIVKQFLHGRSLLLRETERGLLWLNTPRSCGWQASGVQLLVAAPRPHCGFRDAQVDRDFAHGQQSPLNQ